MTDPDVFIIRLEECRLNEERLYKLRNVLNNHPGNKEVILEIVFANENKVKSLSLKTIKIKPNLNMYLEILDFI
tara:strand:+ start:405 stop:626 length:222 start_codon:yes stop_codon:yes gene_type:complete